MPFLSCHTFLIGDRNKQWILWCLQILITFLFSIKRCTFCKNGLRYGFFLFTSYLKKDMYLQVSESYSRHLYSVMNIKTYLFLKENGDGLSYPHLEAIL